MNINICHTYTEGNSLVDSPANIAFEHDTNRILMHFKTFLLYEKNLNMENTQIPNLRVKTRKINQQWVQIKKSHSFISRAWSTERAALQTNNQRERYIEKIFKIMYAQKKTQLCINQLYLRSSYQNTSPKMKELSILNVEVVGIDIPVIRTLNHIFHTCMIMCQLKYNQIYKKI